MPRRRRRLPPLNSLRTFESAARHLSFTKASEELYVTQAAVSHQIKHLEEFLGLDLFYRKNRKLSLTEEGAEYWPKIKTIFEALRNATDEVKSVGLSGELDVSVIPTFAVEWLIPRLDQFKKLYPDIDVRISANNDDKEVDFFGDEIDCAIYFSTMKKTKDVFKEELLKEYLVAVCSPTLLNSNSPLNNPEDLKNHTLLHDSSTDDWKRWLKIAGVDGVDVDHGTIFSHTMMVLQAAIHGQGIAIGHSVVAQKEIDSGRLMMPFDLKIPSRYSYHFACPEEHQNKPKISAFMNWLKDTIARENV